jgi:tRNA-binding protein
MKAQTNYSTYELLDIRVGKIVNVEDSLSKKPTYKMTVDFGPEIGKKISLGAYKNYKKEELIGKQIVGVINFPPKKMGPEVSEFLTLGAKNEKGEIMLIIPQSEVPLGEGVF